jgi:hypothetical protein
MSRDAPNVFLHSALDVKDSLGHAQPSARPRILSRAYDDDAAPRFLAGLTGVVS